MSKSDVLDVLAKGREKFTTREWMDLPIRSIELEPAALTKSKAGGLRPPGFVRRHPR